jgi:hypothetical protein
MQKQIGDELVQVEVVGHKEMKTSDVGKIDSTQL